VLGHAAAVIAQAGGDLDELKLIDATTRSLTHEVTIKAGDAAQANRIAEALQDVSGVNVLDVTDRTFALHSGGKIEVVSALEVRNADDLAMAYTPGVGRVCMAIHADPQRAYDLTIKQNSVAVVTDGSAVLGLGDIGPAAAQPVMEGKALIFREFGGINAFPICLDTKNTDEIVSAIKAIAPVFGGINLEDISAPRCFEIEERCQQDLEIPVFHDDQHGTAVVVLAAMINALKVVSKRLEDVRIVILGTGASGIAVAKLLLLNGPGQIVACDRAGALFRGRTENMNPVKKWLAEHTNPDRLQGSVSEMLKGADVFVGLSGPQMLTESDVKVMNNDGIVFAMANPVPEIMPEEAAPFVRVMATGRSDYPNQINNASCFPGFFRGMLDVRAKRVNDAMKLAAAHALAAIVPDSELSEDYILPSVFNPLIVPTIAAAVGQAAVESGLARAHPGGSRS
jgi:malate dehydrogenase (oxaloacetate-decarboxylating)